MTTPLARPPLSGMRPGALQRPGLSPLPGRRSGGWGRRLLWVAIALAALLGATYVTGRLVEPVRARLADVPAVGEPLFGDPVWPVLWNKQVAKEPPIKEPTAGEKPGATAPSTTAPTTTAPATATPGLTAVEADLARRLADVERREAALKQREAELKVRDRDLASQESRLAAAIAEADVLKVRLEGQLRTEEDRVQVVRAMKPAASAQLFAALTDDEAVAILKHMTADEAAKILAALDPYRAARLLQRLPQVTP